MGRKVRIDMTGQRYGRLVALDWAHRDASGHAHWRFACDCGAETVAHGGNVRTGRTTSCGCFHRETSAARLTVHGHRAAGRHGPTYRAWQQMNDACANPANPAYARIGARGIRVAARWRGDYAAFLADLGERPAGTALARIDAARDFAPDNCRWSALANRPVRAAEGWRMRRIIADAPMRRVAVREEVGAAL